jgi:hypothetical protein
MNGKGRKALFSFYLINMRGLWPLTFSLELLRDR